MKTLQHRVRGNHFGKWWHQILLLDSNKILDVQDFKLEYPRDYPDHEVYQKYLKTCPEDWEYDENHSCTFLTIEGELFSWKTKDAKHTFKHCHPVFWKPQL
jgi:hypothetical protein